MVLKRQYFDQTLKISRRCSPIGHLKKAVIKVGFSLLLMIVTCSPPSSSGLAKPAIPSIAPLSLQSDTDTMAAHVPVLAYYYIWFDTQSWERAKKDYPQLGRYSSDDPTIMRQHIQWAKGAGIDGFIVSWKGTEKLKRRLDQLVEIADEENFKLAIIYESLDFYRNPIPQEQVEADLIYFIDCYAYRSVFDLFEKPLVIWSGIWEYSREEIMAVIQDKRQNIYILASEKNVKDYLRLADLVDGDAYYWSSVDPDTHSGYMEKLIDMGKTVHEHNGLWIAPAAPGYDSLLLGGTTVVERRAGKTLQTELNTALQSLPDAIGLISWNEFSENSHIEPSLNYGEDALNLLAETLPVAPLPK